MPPFQLPPSIRKVAWSLLTFQKAWLGFLSRLPKLRLVVGSNLSFLCTCIYLIQVVEKTQTFQLVLDFPPCYRGKLRDGRACWLRRWNPTTRRQGRLGGFKFWWFWFFVDPEFVPRFTTKKNRGQVWYDCWCQFCWYDWREFAKTWLKWLIKIKHTREQEYVVWTFLEY